MSERSFKLFAILAFAISIIATQTGTPLPIAFVAACVLYVLLPKCSLVVAARRGFAQQSDTELRFDPLDEQALSPELIAMRERAVALGFAPDGPPLRFVSAGEALVVPMLHRDGRMKLTLSSAAAAPARVRCSVVSRFPDHAGWIATQSERPSAYMLAAPGSLKQCFPDAPLDTLLAQHERAMAFVAGEKLELATIPSGEFEDVELWFGRRLHAALRAHPWRYAIAFVFRKTMNTSPHFAPIEQQRAARREIARIRAGEAAPLPRARMVG